MRREVPSACLEGALGSHLSNAIGSRCREAKFGRQSVAWLVVVFGARIRDAGRDMTAAVGLRSACPRANGAIMADERARIPVMRAVGFWWSEFEPWWPHPRDFFAPDWSPEERAAVVEHLLRPAAAQHAHGVSHCRVCGGANGSGEFTDGVWVWPQGLVHYVLRHSVRPSDAFVAWVLDQREATSQHPRWYTETGACCDNVQRIFRHKGPWMVERPPAEQVRLAQEQFRLARPPRPSVYDSVRLHELQQAQRPGIESVGQVVAVLLRAGLNGVRKRINRTARRGFRLRGE
jgi:hypothetical protein